MAGYPTLFDKYLETPEDKHEFHAVIHALLKGEEEDMLKGRGGKHLVHYETLAFSAQKPRPNPN
jgi:hypothetical protein